MAGPDDKRSIIRKNLKRFRDEAGLSQQELAASAGLSGASVYRYEAGKGLPERDALWKLAEVFGRALDDFFNPSPPPPDPARLTAVRFKVVGPLDEDLRAKLVEEVSRINRLQQERGRVAREKMRRGKKD